MQMTAPRLHERTARLFAAQLQGIWQRVDGLFAWLMVGQWVFAVGVAWTFSPYAWEGKVHAVHVHVQTAILAGAVISSLPIMLAYWRPGAALTRHVVGLSQMLWSALLIHLTAGRIETHFHIFASLAFLAFYRDPWVLLSASVTIILDRFARGLLWPESVYGVVEAEWWRFLELAFWVVLTDSVLIAGCRVARREAWETAERRAEAELAHEQKVHSQEQALVRAEQELREFQQQFSRMEKLASVGQLAASISHELRNPLAAARTALSCVLLRVSNLQGALTDSRILHCLDVTERELAVCARIISDVLDFARERPPQLAPCALRPLVDEVVGVVPQRAGVRVHNTVPDSLPVPLLDRELFRMVLVNLVQNAVEAVPPGGNGNVRIHAEGGDALPWRIRVVDDGPGIPEEVLSKIFEPLFTTKTQGTGLGLAIVSALVHKHGGTLSVNSQVGQGTEFLIELPAEALARTA
ncbi:sensor histidine kinase [Pyxidicoccus xibeiensis]|uniref:sensor histidine kinase n=1 Tax=Pyxidicoccus xibeiensis TaxID=2906759 RepID=UPI0020A6ED12|nr:ATP-binding protein [Pyxidicoccus xibeiensis]MCP3139798.1 ATP-binding protein [Pyxidicoccus xibeiensis]